MLAPWTPITLQVSGPDDAVDGEAVAGLKPAYGRLRFGPEVAVDGQAQRVLQSLDGGFGRCFFAPFRAGRARAGGRGAGVSSTALRVVPDDSSWPGVTLAIDADRPEPPRSAALVAGPTIPSTVSPLPAWKCWTASSVSGPKIPSTLIPPSACWRSCTWRPSLPSVRTITCSVVVAGSGPAAEVVLCPLAMLAVGPTVSAASAPSETRLARVPVGTNRSSAARRRARDRPSESCQGSSSARSRGSAPRGFSSDAIEVSAAKAALWPRVRPARARRARER